MTADTGGRSLDAVRAVQCAAVRADEKRAFTVHAENIRQ